MRAYRLKEVQELTGATTARLVHWNRVGLIEGSIQAGAGPGISREYSYDDVVCITVASRLSAGFGLPVASLRVAVGLVRQVLRSRKAHPADDIAILFFEDSSSGKLLASKADAYGQIEWAELARGRCVDDRTGLVVDLAAIEQDLAARGATR